MRIPKLFNGKDRLFFLANYESFRQRRNFNGIYSVPTAAMFGGDFSAVANIIYDPTTKAPFPDNVIPQNRIDPDLQKAPAVLRARQPRHHQVVQQLPARRQRADQ